MTLWNDVKKFILMLNALIPDTVDSVPGRLDFTMMLTTLMHHQLIWSFGGAKCAKLNA